MPKKSKIAVIDLDELFKGPVTVPVREEEKDELEEFLRKIDEYKLKKLKSLELEKMLKEYELELRKLSKQLDESSSEAGELAGLAVQLAKLPEEERKKVLEMYAILKSVEKGATSALIPLLMSSLGGGFGSTNSSGHGQQSVNSEEMKELREKLARLEALLLAKAASGEEKSSKSEIAELINAVATLLKTMREIEQGVGQQSQQAQTQQEQVNPIKLAMDIISLAQQLQSQTQTQGTGNEEMLRALIAKLDELKEVSSLSDETRRELEKIRAELDKYKLDLELKKAEIEANKEIEKERWRAIANILSQIPLGSIARSVIGRGSESQSNPLGGNPAPQVQAQIQIPPGYELAECPVCKNRFIVSKEAVQVVCPYCGTRLIREGIQEKIQSSVSETRQVEKSGRVEAGGEGKPEGETSEPTSGGKPEGT